MTPEKPSRIRTVLVVVVIVAIAAISSAFYFNGLTRLTDPSSSSTSGPLNTVVSTTASSSAAQGQTTITTTTTTTTVIGGSTNSSGTASGGGSGEAIYAAESHSVVTIQGDEVLTVSTVYGPQTSIATVLGSGFAVVYQNSYYVVTNYHVVNGVSNMTVTFWNGDAFQGRVVGTDAYSDLAMVAVSGAPTSEFIPLTIVSSSPVSVGDPVYAIGAPYGLSGSFTYGIVSQLGRTIQEATTGNYSIAGVIQFSAPINPGNSGGPLLDGAGNVIGITTATVSGSVGVGFAIPSSTILKELPSLISAGTYKLHSYMGIGGADMNYQLAQDMQVSITYGVLIENVVSGGPAASAGLRVGSTVVVVDGQQYIIGGDVIVSINGTRIVNQDALSTYLAQNTLAGQNVQIGIIRSGQTMTVGVLLEARPPATG